MATERELRLHRIIFAGPTPRQRDLSRRVVAGEALPSDVDLLDRGHEIIAQQSAADIAAEDLAIATSAANEEAYLTAIDEALALLAADTGGDSVANTIALLEAAGGTSPE